MPKTLPSKAEVQLDGRTLILTNQQKVLFPRDGYTKGDLVNYYRGVAPWILPHLRDIPLTLQRYPDGIDGQSFFEKHLPRGLPDWAARVPVSSPEGHRETTVYMLCNDEATLTFVANLASIVLHAGVSSLEQHEPPFPEWFAVPEQTAQLVAAARGWGGRVVAVGTTVVRALETAAGEDGSVKAGRGWTNLVITPERGLRAVDGLITGWHEPEASHLELLGASAGRELLHRCYREALTAGYLWHEFGDSHLILP